MREDELDRCVTVLKLRATRERIRAREGHSEGRKEFGGSLLAARIGRMEAVKRIETFRSEKDSSAREIQ
jgi:hypothetical protein